jgi:hypothetical protein
MLSTTCSNFFLRKQMIKNYKLMAETPKSPHVAAAHVSQHELFSDRSIRFAADLFRCSGDDLGAVIENTKAGG